jgi:threonyl-tRNA synthetase
VVVVPIAERHQDYANTVAKQLADAGVRVHVDGRNEKMNAKIREHALQKVPFILIAGDKEAASGAVNVRTRGHEKTEDMAATEFVAKVKGLIESRAAEIN